MRNQDGTKMDAAAALKLIRDIGVGGLGGFDGCLCTSFEVHGVKVDVSCRKSSGSDTAGSEFYGTLVRVHSDHMDADDGLVSIAQEVAEQVLDQSPDVLVRFTDYRHDKECLCVYCGQPRQSPSGYLCDACVGRPRRGATVGEDYAWMNTEIRLDGYAAADRLTPDTGEPTDG
jgi:hypothetical protein